MAEGLEWLDEQTARMAGRRRQRGAERDDDEGTVPAPRASERHDLLLHLHYRDSAGDISERTVLVREVFRREGVIYLGGHCHLREMTRVFRSDRIELLANGRTGEVIEDAADFLEGIAPPDDKALATMGYREGRPLVWTGREASALRQRARPLAVMMMALAKADGEWHPEEVRVLEALVDDAASALGLKPDIRGRLRLVGEFAAIAPSGNLLTRACKAVLVDRQTYSDAPGWCRRMIEADGRTKPDELHEYRAIVGRLAELAGEM